MNNGNDTGKLDNLSEILPGLRVFHRSLLKVMKEHAV